uniref:Uncharacterized protein n=1 Tax=Timema bartmani TaxID=61472 RepID=A0A7R9EWQ2_9NEOP|nr:unnamed protein product [Timema bartmani]
MLSMLAAKMAKMQLISRSKRIYITAARNAVVCVLDGKGDFGGGGARGGYGCVHKAKESTHTRVSEGGKLPVCYYDKGNSSFSCLR